jgi:hypothetical protein
MAQLVRGYIDHNLINILPEQDDSFRSCSYVCFLVAISSENPAQANFAAVLIVAWCSYFEMLDTFGAFLVLSWWKGQHDGLSYLQNMGPSDMLQVLLVH